MTRSIDITTFYPCATSPVYTSVAPTIVAPPIYLPQTVAPAAPLAAPIPYPTYQYPTIWNGADVLSGGNAQWAQVVISLKLVAFLFSEMWYALALQEDAAINAATLQNWRIRILQVSIPRLPSSCAFLDCICNTRFAGQEGPGGAHPTGC